MLLVILLLLAKDAAAGKLGLCCMECDATEYGPFANVSSWAYRYSLFVDDPGAAQWLVDNQVEFVPHLAHKHVPLPGGDACNLDAAKGETPLCTAAMLDRAAAAARVPSRLTVTYMMGWNEAYDKGNSKAAYKYIAPADAATFWRVYVQGMAARANLSLVSPTTGVEPNKLAWLGNMILECWAQRRQGCDVETIVAFSVHDYKCGEEYWRAAYGPGGTFQAKLKAHLYNASHPDLSLSVAGLSVLGDAKNWSSYVDARQIWVTETNCNGDYGFPPTQAVSGEEQCRRITGQRAGAECGQYGKCGVGSIAAMESMPTIARVSWWNTHQQNAQHRQKTADAMLVDDTGTLYPPGRALVGGLSSRVDCAAPPPSPAATCDAQLAKDGCDPEQGPKACGACAQLHRADLDRVGCSAANVTDYCEGKLPPALH